MKGYCKKCEAFTEGQSRGAQHYCSVCGKFTGKHEKPNVKQKSDGYSAEYVVTSQKRISTHKELIALLELDEKEWAIDKFEVGRSEGYRKDRQVEWNVSNGIVSNGKVKDTGKILVVPLYTVRVWVSRKTQEIRNNLVVDNLIKKAKKHAPKYKKIKYKRTKNNLFELDLPDMQLGRLVAAEDAGFDLDPTMQIKKADSVIDDLLGKASLFGVSRVLFPIGNDFFDTNSADMSTAHGTPQQDDIRWKRTYKLGCDFIVRTIEKLTSIAPVDVLVIPGNHDEDKIFHLGEYVYAWNRNNKNVNVDNRPMKRKYYQHGKNLIGFTHGYYEKYNKLDSLMSYEVPHLWSESVFREWHLGDKHHKVDMVMKTNELENGVVVRILRSLATPSIWEYDKGLVGSLKAGEAFLWGEKTGVEVQLTSTPKVKDT